MNTKILYSFTIYLRQPRLIGFCSLFPNTSTSVEWDSAITIMASNVDEALKNIPEGYEHMEIVKVDYPGGWPHFPLFPPSICSSGAVGVDSYGNHYLRAV